MAIKSLLVIRFSAIGDLLLTAPILTALSSEAIECDLLVKSKCAEVATALPGVREIKNWEYDKEELLKNAKERYDAVLDLQGTRQSRTFATSLGLPTATFHKPYLKRALLLWTKHPRFALEPVVNRYQRAAETLLQKPLHLPTTIDFNLPASPINTQAPCVVAVIGGSQKGKRLSTDQWAKALRAPLAKGYEIILLGGPSDAPQAAELTAQIPQATDATSTTVIEGLAIVSSAAAVISGDTGFMHAAALMHKPLVSMWGATHPALGFAPWPVGEQQKTVVAKSWWTPLHKHGKVPFWAPNPMRKLDMGELTRAIEQILPDRTTP